MTYRATTVDDLQDIASRDGTHMRPVRHHLGITAFGANAWTVERVGDRLMPEHDEDEGKEELYVVLRGRARFEIDGETLDAPAGTLVFVPPAATRTAFAEDAETVVLAVGSTVGKAYEVGGWEIWAEFHPDSDLDALRGEPRSGRCWRRAARRRRQAAGVRPCARITAVSASRSGGPPAAAAATAAISRK